MMKCIAIIIGWLADKIWGDPAWLPHPVVYFGKAIAWGEHWLNKGRHRRLKGGILAVSLILLTFLITWALLRWLRPVTVCGIPINIVIEAILI
ncbi:MAG: cobalamin biosynthesis protein, partial [Prevotella sp.]|nr:cobalamin biosynthesis protein [Prevotella sp.]